MNAEKVPSLQKPVEDALRRLVHDPLTRHFALEAIDEAVASAESPAVEKMRVLAHINREELIGTVDRLEKDAYQFADIADDSPKAHRCAADIQRILTAFGFDLGPNGIDGYTGGPPGKPLVLDLNEVSALSQRGRRRQKLLGLRSEGGAESWTRDATRRLQYFLGSAGLPQDAPDLRRDCLVQTDGLFGSLTLAGVRTFLESAGITR